MKLLRTLALTVLFVAGVFSAVVYVSCNKNKCDKVVCLNLGTCYGGNCVCPTGFEGSRCQNLTRNRFLATYQGGDSCTHNVHSYYPLYLLAVLSDSVEMNMKNFLGNMQDSAICTIQSADSFTFIGSNNSTSFTGWGRMRNDSLWLVYHVVHDTTSYDCSYFGQSYR